MAISRRSIFKLSLIIFFVYFVPLFYITESIIWATILAAIATSPIGALWAFFSWLKRIKQNSVEHREPYIIGDSDKVEYLTPEELEDRLRKRKSGDKSINRG